MLKWISIYRLIVSRHLELLLKNDYLFWLDITLGKKRQLIVEAQTTSFYIVLHLQRGLLFLEIKDWKLSTIKDINHERVVLRTDRGEKTMANPLEQARQCAYQLAHQNELSLWVGGNEFMGAVERKNVSAETFCGYKRDDLVE